MHYAVFSNINGNIENLAMMLDFLKEEKIDIYICLGNIVCYGANPNECIELLKKMKSIVLAGQLDQSCAWEEELEAYNDFDKKAILKARETLTPENRGYLSNLKPTYSDGIILATHYSPASLSIQDYISSPWDAEQTISTFSERVCFVASLDCPAIYSILPLTRKIQVSPDKAVEVKNFKQYLVNTGSLYNPFNPVDTSRLAVYNQEGKVIVLHQFPFDTPDNKDNSDLDDGPDDGNELAGSPAKLPPKLPIQDQDKHDWPKE